MSIIDIQSDFCTENQDGLKFFLFICVCFFTKKAPKVEFFLMKSSKEKSVKMKINKDS